MSVFKSTFNHHPGQLAVGAELVPDEILEGHKDGVNCGEGSGNGALGSGDEYLKAGSLSSENLVWDRGKSIPACAGIMKDSAILL